MMHTALPTEIPVTGARVPTWQRVLVAAIVGTLAMSLTFQGPAREAGTGITDFGQPWFAALAILHHADPYRLIGPNGIYHHEFPLFYPLTAAVAVLPLGLLREAQASAVFVWISAGLLAYAITANGWERLPLFLSTPFLIAAYQAQWSPILAAGFCLPALAWLFAAKPTIGIALLASTGSVRTFTIAIAGGAALFLISLLFLPQWPAEWLRIVRAETHMIAPILRPGGFLALAALLRWRRPEARLIAALACVPQTIVWYDVVVLLLVASTFRESLFLAVTTTLPTVYEMMFGLSDGTLDLYPRSSFVLMAAVYIPAILLVLRRPNEGEPPAWFQLLRGRRAVPNRVGMP
jgi:hypothetical protein